MLTEDKKLENKQRYIDLIIKLGIDASALVQYLDSDRVDFFNKPFSTFTGAYSGELCEKALKLYDELVKLCQIYRPDKYSESDLIIASLFRDIYRAELIEPYSKNIKNECTGQWEAQIAYRYKEVRPIFGDVHFSSYMITRKFINLENDELVEALCFSSINTNNIELHNIRRDYSLTTLLTMADLAVNYLQ